MKCFEHQEQDATVQCVQCGKALCNECAVSMRGKFYCRTCLANGVSPQQLKNPGLAAVLSFLWTGLGQIYNGQIGKGIAFLIIGIINGLLMFVIIGFITAPIWWIFNIYDAYSTANKINTGEITVPA